MNKSTSIAENLRSGRTPAGRSVRDWADAAREQNYAYRTVEDLFDRITGQAFELHPQDENKDLLIAQVTAALRANIDNPLHYRERYDDAEPGIFGVNGEQLFVDPRRSYEQLFVDPRRSYGLLVAYVEDSDDGLPGFLHACGLPLDTPRKVIIGCAALLNLDVALDEIEQDKPWRVTWTLYGITESAEEIQEIIVDEHYRAQRRKKAAAAGQAAHRDTNEFKKEVLKAWAENRFKSIAACARWACRQYPIEADETPKRWIREYKKALLG